LLIVLLLADQARRDSVVHPGMPTNAACRLPQRRLTKPQPISFQPWNSEPSMLLTPRAEA
jgi:hypothetical protein